MKPKNSNKTRPRRGRAVNNMGVSPQGAIGLNQSKFHRFKVYMSRNYPYYLFILPTLIWYIVFMYVPIYGLQIAFRDYRPALGFLESEWRGLHHFRRFFNSYYFWPVIKNTVVVSLYSLIAGFPLPIIFALMLNELKSPRIKKNIQTISYAPHFISTVVLVGMLGIFFDPRFGMVNNVLASLGSDRINFLYRPESTIHLYVWSGVWQGLGWGSIIYVAALAAVDNEILEAATVDGATRMQKIRYINLPTLVPTIVIMLILNVGSIMNVGFDKMFLMYNELNSDRTLVVSIYVYLQGIENMNYSFSSAVGLFNNVINFIFLFVANQIAKRATGTSFF